jgi:hypothetical protein
MGAKFLFLRTFVRVFFLHCLLTENRTASEVQLLLGQFAVVTTGRFYVLCTDAHAHGELKISGCSSITIFIM